MYQPLVKFARRRLPSSSDPEDIVQESFLKVMERIDPDVIESAPSYLTTVVRNRVIGELRTRAAQERATARLVEPDKPDPLTRIEEHELSDAVNKLTSRLPSRQRRFISLYAIGLSPAEIAKVESSEGRALTANQVSCTLSRATTRLRSLLEGRDFAFVFGGTADLFRRARLKLVQAEYELGTAASMGVAHLVLAIALTIGGAYPSGQLDDVQAAQASAPNSPQQNFHVTVPALPIAQERVSITDGPAQTEKSNIVSLETASFWEREDRKGKAPGLIQQITDLVSDPSGIDPIHCGGLPVCSD